MKTKLPHHVPLSQQAVEAFTNLRAMNSKWPWIFPGRAPTKPMSKNTILFACTAWVSHPHDRARIPRTCFNDAERDGLPARCDRASVGSH